MRRGIHGRENVFLVSEKHPPVASQNRIARASHAHRTMAPRMKRVQQRGRTKRKACKHVRADGRSCSSVAKLKGLCIRHGGGKPCQHKGEGERSCNTSAYSKGFCSRHGGGTRCIHEIPKKDCYECAENRSRFCQTKPACPQKNRVKQGRINCGFCEGRQLGVQRIEHAWQEVFKAWDFHASLVDKAIHVCDEEKRHLINRFRPDWLFLLHDCEFDVLLECDECEHCGISVECEYTRMYAIWDSLCKAKRTNRKLVVVRFNPQKTNDEDGMKTLFGTLKYVFEHLSKDSWASQLPVYLFATIGFSERRVRLFKRYDASYKPKEPRLLNFKDLHDDREFETVETTLGRLANRVQEVALFDSTIYKGKLIFCETSGKYYAKVSDAAMGEGCLHNLVSRVLNRSRKSTNGKVFKYV